MIAGEVQAQVHHHNGALLLSHHPRRDRDRHRHIVGLQREQPDRPDRRGHFEFRGRGDSDLHVARRPPRRGFHEPQGAEQREAAASHQHMPALRGRFDVSPRKMGLENYKHIYIHKYAQIVANVTIISCLHLCS